MEDKSCRCIFSFCKIKLWLIARSPIVILFSGFCFLVLIRIHINLIDNNMINLLTKSGFQMTVEKPKPKQLLRPITTGANSAVNQSQFPAITSNSLKEREKSRVHDAIGFGFASHQLKNWWESFKPITKHSNRNHIITFDSHLKTALV